MATGSQGQGHQGQGQGRRDQGRDRNNGGTGQPGQFAGQGQQGVEQVGQRLREGYDSAREEMGRRYRWAEGTVARNPSGSILIGFGVGFGVGLALTAMLAHREESWAEQYLPESFRDLPDSLRNRVPEGVRDFHWSDAYDRLCQAVQNLPGAIGKAVHAR